MRRLLLALILLAFATQAAAQTFSTDFENANLTCTNCFGFAAIATPDLPTGSSITALPTGGWNGTQGAQITINSCSGGTCDTAVNQGNAGWNTPALGGSYSVGDTRYWRYRIKLTSSIGDAAGKFSLFGSTTAERVNQRFDRLMDTNGGCHPTGEGNDFYDGGPGPTDPNPATAWTRATEFGLGGSFSSLRTGSQSNYAGMYVGINISWNCAVFVVLPNYPTVADIKPQQNAAISQSGWVHLQFAVTSGTAGNVNIKVWANNNDFANPTAQCINCTSDGTGGLPVGVAGWSAAMTFGGFWGMASTTPITFVVDDFAVASSFNSSFYEAAGAAAPTVSSVSASSGTTAGGVSVTITGANFVATPTSITFGGSACTGIGFTNSTTLTCTTPAHSAGAVDVVVTNPDAQAGTGVGVYTYVTPTVGPTRLRWR